jgi:hypothetical protein
MIDLIYGLGLSIAAFTFIMALIIVIGRSVGRWFGPEEDR